ncbi:hypothetical protein [Janibacter hoylei]|uniref:hypothetical protein n=1 Tax=Janibacter hoylei TaxID=364298 RepID=UPI0021A4A727|nr:hypothetical protein [Janibacter hoylei]MCT1617658.1 hypothetical protein [Janibacter hoylei]MCT2291819.1 hypothetical protein [Janibacter hoylei]
MKSKDRVKAYGEVFTPRHMVDQMLDLVSEELESGPDFVDKTFLEPSAGDGNFLVRILQRKLAAIESRLPAETWQRESLFALASIYGIELLGDNHAEAKAAMLEVFLDWHAGHSVAVGAETDLARTATFLIDTNIIRGNTLTGLTPDGEEIEFSWWHRGADDMVTREPFTFSSMRGGGGMFDFTDYDSYAPCPIDRVYEGVLADG